MRVVWVVAFAAMVAAAGCSEPAAVVGPEVVVKSAPEEIRSNATSAPLNAPPRTPGHISGVVVDQAIRPIAGAKVHLPGMDLEHEAARDGSFSFTELYPGAYFLTATADGHETAEAVVQVEPDQIVRVKFILKARPPPTPYHVTQKFTGYTDLSGTIPLFIGSPVCGTCRFTVQADPAARAFVIEAVMDPSQWAGTLGTNSFQYYAAPEACCESYLDGEAPNPMRLLATPATFGNETSVELTVTPDGFPLPETSKSFEEFVTAWYNADPPAEWAVANGST